MKSWSNEFKVGLFSIIAVLILMYMYRALNSGVEGESITYYSIMKNAGGLVAKSQVKTNGVLIGFVEKIKLERNQTKLTLSLNSEVKIPVGSLLEIRSQGMLGDVFIEIIRSNDAGKYIAEKGMIGTSGGAGDLNSLMILFGEIGQDVKRITGALASSVDSDSGRSNIEQMMDNLNKMTSDLVGVVDTNKTGINNIIDNLNVTTGNLREVFGNRNDVVKMKEDLTLTIEALNSAATAIEEIVNSGGENSLVSKIDGAFTSLDQTASNMNEITGRVNRGEGTVGRLLADDTTINKIDRTLDSIQNITDPMNKTQFNFDYHNEVQIRDFTDEVKHVANFRIQPRPDKYYLLGVSDNYTFKTVEKTTKTNLSQLDDGGTESRVVEQSNTEERFKINLQIAKRWNAVALRFGIFDSKGGFGSDVFMLNDNLKLGFEAYDWDFAESSGRKFARFRATADYTIFNHIYATAGADDLSRLTADGDWDQPGLFFGAGLKFNDEDIRTIFGLAASAAASR